MIKPGDDVYWYTVPPADPEVGMEPPYMVGGTVIEVFPHYVIVDDGESLKKLSLYQLCIPIEGV